MKTFIKAAWLTGKFMIRHPWFTLVVIMILLPLTAWVDPIAKSFPPACMIRDIYHESTFEPVRGQTAVALSVFNRRDDPRWPDNICGVVYQKWQYSWANPYTLRKEPLPGVKYPLRLYLAAVAGIGGTVIHQFPAVAGVVGLDKFVKVNHYHRVDVKPTWRLLPHMKRVGKIRLHIFYRTI